MSNVIDAFEAGALLTSFVDKSLVVFDDSTGRYRLLETVRQYARERLLETGAGEALRDKHLAHFLAMSEEAEPHLMDSEQKVWLERLETEHDNLRAALEWSGAEDPEAGLRLAGAIWRFWVARGHRSEGWERLSMALTASLDAEPSVRGKAMLGAGNLAWRQGYYAAARALYEESLTIFRELGDRWGIAASLGNLGTVAQAQGDYAAAHSLHEESLVIRRELGDRWGIANSLNNLGNVAHEQGDYPTAQALYEKSLVIFRELGDRWNIANSLGNLGCVAQGQGDYAAALALHEESLAIYRELGHQGGIAESLGNLGIVAHEQSDYAAARSLHEESLAIRSELGYRQGIAGSLEGIAAAAGTQGDTVRGARLWGAAERLREEIGFPLRPNERPRYEQQVAAARAAMDNDAAFDAAWKEGRAMSMEEAIELAILESDS